MHLSWVHFPKSGLSSAPLSPLLKLPGGGCEVTGENLGKRIQALSFLCLPMAGPSLSAGIRVGDMAGQAHYTLALLSPIPFLLGATSQPTWRYLFACHQETVRERC